jgi:hypothetical protein
LNGLFLIDDVRDADATNTHGKDEPEPKKTEPKKTEPKAAPVQKTVKDMVEEDLKRKVTKEDVQGIIKGLKEHEVDVAELLALYKKKSLADFTKYQHDHVFGHGRRNLLLQNLLILVQYLVRHAERVLPRKECVPYRTIGATVRDNLQQTVRVNHYGIHAAYYLL